MPACFDTIGTSREGRPIRAACVGSGPLRVSVVAGAHAEEPAGPRTAERLANALANAATPCMQQLVERFTFFIVPHVNPDGAHRNAAWIRDEVDLVEYVRASVRELPGDDVEFNYPRDATDRATRPENLAVADFLREAGGPFAMHASLHGMAFAEGAWFLVCREWAERARTSGMTERLANAAGRAGLGLHDLDRGGEKGFHRIAPGFCTTPRADAMRDFFLERGDGATAALFRPSSMDFVQSLGGDPLCFVSELPLFTIGAIDEGAPGAAYERLRSRLPEIRAALERDDRGPLEGAVAEFALRWVPWETQSALQMAFLLEALDLGASG